MKKTIKFGVMLLMVMFILTGCINSETAFKLNKDDSFDITMTSTIDDEKYKEVLQMFSGGESMTDEQAAENLNQEMESYKKNYETLGYNTEMSTNDSEKTRTIVAKKRYDNIDQIKENILDFSGLEDITITDREDGKREIIIKMDMSEGTEGMEEIIKDFKYTFKLELPYSISESNATEVSNGKKTLTWNIGFTEPIELKVVTNKLVKNEDGTYKEDFKANAIIIVGAIIVTVAIVGIVIVFTSKKTQKEEDTSVEKPVESEKTENFIETSNEEKPNEDKPEQNS